MATQVVEDLTFGAILKDLPGQEVVEAVAVEIGSGQQIGATGAWLGKNFAAVVKIGGRRGRFIAIVKGAIAAALGVTIRLLIAL